MQKKVQETISRLKTNIAHTIKRQHNDIKIIGWGGLLLDKTMIQDKIGEIRVKVGKT